MSLRDRTQLTHTGTVTSPTISPDGKTLAYVVKDCSGLCRYAVEIQDVGSTSSRRLLEGASAVYGLEISADRRNVLVLAMLNGVFGSYILPTLGGSPRLVVKGQTAFLAGGDSLVMVRASTPARTFWALISALDAEPVDSIRIDGPADRVVSMAVVPGSNRIFYALVNGSTTTWYSSDRTGKRYHTMEFPPGVLATGVASTDALWLYMSTYGATRPAVVRFPFDPETGILASRGDTVYSGLPTGLGVTADGGTVVFDEGTAEFAGWAMPLDDLLKGRFREENRIYRGTSQTSVSLSADGKLLALGRAVAGSNRNQRQWSVMPYPRGPETPLPGRHNSVRFVDSTTVSIVNIGDTSTEMFLLDYRTGRRYAQLTVPEKSLRDFVRAGADAWMWISPSGGVINVQRDGERAARQYRIPSWYNDVFRINSSFDGSTAAFLGWKAPSADSLGLGLLSLDDGRFTQAWATIGEGGAIRWHIDGSLLVIVFDTSESDTYYRWWPDGRIEKLGAPPRPAWSMSVSADFERAFVTTRNYRGDAWMSTVVR